MTSIRDVHCRKVGVSRHVAESCNVTKRIIIIIIIIIISLVSQIK
jgi:hypothetical protein